MLIGYARVSTKRQRLDLQLSALRAAKCDIVISERLSGDGIGRGLLSAIATCRKDDVLVVWKLDRLSRNVMDLMGLANTLRNRGIQLKILTGAASVIDIKGTEGQALYAIYAAFAELERDMNRERTIAGIRTKPTRRSGKSISDEPGGGCTVRQPLRSAFNRSCEAPRPS